MPIYTFNVNGESRKVTAAPGTPLLWILRDTLGLTGTKFGCGRALCGACTVHVDGEAVRSCVTLVETLAGREITTIEGIAPTHAVKRAWIAEEVPQCGYCQPGQIMSAAALLVQKPRPTDADIDAALAGNLCRCGTYNRIRRAVHRAASSAAGGDGRQ